MVEVTSLLERRSDFIFPPMEEGAFRHPKGASQEATSEELMVGSAEKYPLEGLYLSVQEVLR